MNNTAAYQAMAQPMHNQAGEVQVALTHVLLQGEVLPLEHC